ncbi:MAG: DinB family protein [Acidobacteriota bacterium]
MAINEGLIGELEMEAATTRKVLERIPAEVFDWKPHEKSMTMGRLATHVADMFAWYIPTLEADELDFAAGYEEPKCANAEDLTAVLDKNVAAATESLRKTDDETLRKLWKLRNGENVFFEIPKIQVLRGMVMNHIIHHRGQLSVYLRLNSIPVPAIYGPSADEGSM